MQENIGVVFFFSETRCILT